MYHYSRLAAAVVGILLLAAGCSAPQPPKALPPEVQTVEATARTLPEYSEYIGQTYGKSDIDIIPRVEGWVTGIHFKEGSTVTQGQLLYTIDDTQLKNQEEAASSQLAEQEVMLVKAKADLDRVEPLAAMNALSRRDLDAARAAYQAQLKSVEAAKAFYRNAQVQTSYTRITAPISGVIGISSVLVGDLVSRTSRPINTISSTGEIRIRFSIPETDFLKFQQAIKAGTMKSNPEVDVMLSDGSLFPEKAYIDFTDRNVDPRTGSLLVQAVVTNTGQEKLRPGQYVKVRAAATELENAVIVPQQAVNQLQTIFQVFVIDTGDTLRPRPVKTGPRIGSNWVITEGLKAGERVAVVGNMIVKPNSMVKPVPMTWSYDSTLVQ